jgi:predicted AlkP superfamily phosphohydrolase/phosphomutase
MYERVFVIEITGLRLGFLRERLEHLPHLRRIAEHGALGRLTGPRQPVLPTSYAALYTGKNPGKTGFFDFFRFSKGGYDRVPYSLDQLEEETLFQRISAHGKTIGMLNVPITHPLPDVRGFVVSADEGVGEQYARPADVLRELTESGYRPHFGASYSEGREVAFYRHCAGVLKRRRDAGRHLFTTRDWQFGMCSLHEYSELMHGLWKFYDPRHPDYRSFREIFGDEDPFLDLLVAIDEFVGEVTALVGPRGLIIVLGAWGHDLEHSRVHLNNWLARRGWLRFRRSPKSLAKRAAFRMGISSSGVEQVAHRLNLYKLFHYGLPRGKRAAMTGATFLSYADVDWARTRAVSMGYLGQVFLNVEGRRSEGTVPQRDYEAERRRLRDDLLELRDPRSGDKVIERVWTREEIYSGPRIDLGPDLIPEYREGYSGDAGIAGGGQVVTESPVNHSSDHCTESVFLALGDGVRRGEIEARLEDVAPTVLYAMGVPLASDYDGRVLPIFG